MPNKHNLGDLRVAIEDAIQKVMENSGNGEAPNDLVIEKLRSGRASLVAHFSRQLEDIALIKLLNEVSPRRGKNSGIATQNELFESFGNIPSTVSLKRGLKKATSSLTLGEAREWSAAHSKRPIANPNEDLIKLISMCGGIANSDNETLGELITRLANTQGTEQQELLPA